MLNMDSWLSGICCCLNDGLADSALLACGCPGSLSLSF